MPTFIVCTNFSETSRNALAYTCAFISSQPKPEDTSILLLNVYTIPASYSGDGIALAAVEMAIQYSEEDLHEELEWAHEEFGGITIIGKLTAGRLVEGLREQVNEMAASIVVLGAGGHYGELWSWDNEILTALRDLSVPVLTIPPGVTFSPLQNIAFACNLRNYNRLTNLNALKSLVELTHAKLHVVYVTSREKKAAVTEADNEELVRKTLAETAPEYYTLPENEVVGAIGRFAVANQVQLLAVIPRKQGIWEALFQKSFTKELSKLNTLPIMALH